MGRMPVRRSTAAVRDLDWAAEADPPLPELDPAAADQLRPGTRLDAVALTGLDGDVSLTDATLLECHVTDAALDALELSGARVRSTLIERLKASSLDGAGSSWMEVVGRELRVGAFDLHGADLARVRLAGRVDYLTARGGTWSQVDLGGCQIGELDLTGATLTQVRLAGARIGRLVLGGAELDRVDLRAATLESLDGVERLRGAVLDDVLLAQLAPALAAHCGIRVLPA